MYKRQIRACRKVNADIPIMIHLDNGGNNELYVRCFTNFSERGEEFEYIGLSYYPFWHGSLDQLEFNMNDIAKRFNCLLYTSFGGKTIYEMSQLFRQLDKHRLVHYEGVFSDRSYKIGRASCRERV